VEVSVRIQETHSEVVLPAVDFALAMAGVARAEVGAVVVGTGPGSFTGLRVAAAIAKGWWFASDVKLYGYSTLLVLAVGAGAEDRPICACLDARRGEVYAACYGLGAATPQEWIAPAVFDVEALGRRLRELDRTPLCVGPGAAAYRAALERDGWPVAGGPTLWPRASTLLWLHERWPEAGAVLDPNQWEPSYVRDSGARARRGTAG
jgi:tRNA threonylcarbamoyladenosine biosynthesis protein TsaB